LVISLVLGLSLSQVGWAQQPPAVGSEFQVNTYTTGHQGFHHISVATDTDGDFVVVWDSFQGSSTVGVIGQRFNSTGAKVGSEFQVNTYSTAQGYKGISVASDADGDFVVVWSDNENHGFRGQRYDSTGTPQGSEFQVDTYNFVDHGPSVAADADGEFVAVWTIWGQDGDRRGVFGRRFNSTGAKVGSEFQVNTYTTGHQGAYGLSVATDADGDFVVVWNSSNQDGDSDGVFGQRFNQINTYNTGLQGYYGGVAVAAHADGDFVVVWDSDHYSRPGDNWGVFGQRFNSAGARVGSEFQVNTYTTGYQGYSGVSVAAHADGGFVVVWDSHYGGSWGPDGDGDGVFGQRFNSAGAKVGSEFQVNTYTTGDQGRHSAPHGGVGISVAAHADGGFVVVWNSSNQDGDGDGVFGQRFAAAGPPSIPATSRSSRILLGVLLALTMGWALRRRISPS
jgi:hypothetical protein